MSGPSCVGGGAGARSVTEEASEPFLSGSDMRYRFTSRQSAPYNASATA